MGFGDDDLATRSRVEVLEREVRELRAENEQLQAQPSTSAGSALRPRLRIAIFAFATLALLAMVAAALVGDFMFSLLMSLFAVLFLALAAPLILLRNNLLFVPAQHVLVVSGRQRQTADGRQVGYRLVTSGSTFRMPVLEKSDLLPTGPFRIEADIASVYLKGSQRADIRMHANFRIPVGEPGVHNAIERFVGRANEEIQRVAKETLEGTLREVAATMTMDEFREERDHVATRARRKSQQDFERLGLHVDTLEIPSIAEVHGNP